MPTNNLPSQNHLIDVTTAAEMTKRYRDNLTTVLQSSYATQGILPLNETFNKAAFAAFMNNADCEALRIYYGMQEDLSVHLIIAGVNAENEDMVPAALLTGETVDPLLEDSQRCPPSCPPASLLNQD